MILPKIGSALHLYLCSHYKRLLIPQATQTYSQFGSYVKLYTLFARGESDADVLLGLDADAEVGAQCQAEGLARRSVNMMLIVQPAPLFLQISCVAAVGASPRSQIHPNKDKQLVNNEPLRGFIVSHRRVVISVLRQFLSIIKIN